MTDEGRGAAGDERDEAVRRAVDDGFPAAVAALGDLVRIPSVSFPGFDPAALERSAEAVAARFTALGAFETVEVRRAARPDGSPGNPAVVARRPARAGAPTVLLYAHHDVQPPGPDAAWTTEPFVPTLRGDRLYGRGASDDKAGVVTHLAAITAVLAAEAAGGLGLALFVEGEEEAGSGSFAAFLADNHDLLAADVIVVADSDNPGTAVPALTTSLRGNIVCRVTVSTLGHPSHSGMYGGAVPDAMLATIRMLDALWDVDGSVAVPGFAGVEPARPDDDPAAADDLARDADLLPGVHAIGAGSVADRLWRGPAITVTGIDAPDVRNASNTLAASITVKISARVPPGVRAADAFTLLERHLRDAAPFGAVVEITDVDLGDPYLADTGSAVARTALGALRDGWGAEPALTGIGGSIPFIATLTETFPDARILITGVEDPDTRAHAPDESQHLGVLKRSILAEALLLARLAHGDG